MSIAKKSAKELQNEMTKAKEWCEKARNILKIKQSGPRFDKDSLGSKAIDKALSTVTTSLESLKKKQPAKYDEFAREFIRLSEGAHTAVTDGNKKQAELLADELNHLNDRILHAKGELTENELKRKQQGLVVEQRLRYEETMDDAHRRLDRLAELNEPPHVFDTVAKQLVDSAAQEAEAKRFDEALKIIGKLPAEHVKQLKSHDAYSQYKRDRVQAAEYEQKLKILDQLNTTQHAAGVTEVLKGADGLFDQFKYTEASTKLTEAATAYSTATKKLSKGDFAKVETFKNAKASFEKAYLAYQDKINKSEIIRDALVDGEVKTAFDRAKVILASCRRDVDQAYDVNHITTAETKLESIDGYLKAAKEAAAEAKVAAQNNLKATAEYQSLLRAGENALALIKSMPSTEAEQKELFLLLGEARSKIVVKNQLNVGYPEAVTILQKYPAIVERAEKKHKEMMTLEFPPQLTKAVENCMLKISQIAGIGPKFIAGIHHDELERQTGEIRVKMAKADQKTAAGVMNTAIQELTQFEQTLSDEVNQLRTDKDEAEATLRKFRLNLEGYISTGAPAGTYADIARTADRAEQHDMIDHEWHRAKTKLDTAQLQLDELMKLQDKFGGRWSEVVNTMGEMKALAGKLIKWPPTMTASQQLIEKCLSIESQFNSTFDYEACLNEFDKEKLTAAFADLKNAERSTPVDFENVQKALHAANQEVTTAVSQVRRDLWAIEDKLSQLAEPQGTDLHKRLTDISNAWDKYFLSREPDQATGIENKRRDAMEKINALATDVDKLKKNPAEFQKFAENAKRAESSKFASKYPQHVKDLLDKVENSGIDASKYRRQYDVVIKANVDVNRLLAPLETDLLKELNTKRKELLLKLEKAAELKENALNLLKQCKSDDPMFNDYHKKLEASARDIQRMLDTGDPELLTVARQALAELAEKIGQIHPDLQRGDEITYAAVEARWTELGLLLGTQTGSIMKDSVVKKRLPDTYARLNASHIDAVAIAKSSAPKDGMAALDKLEAPIKAAVEEALRVNDEYARHEERVRIIENFWDEVKQKTGTKWYNVGNQDSSDGMEKFVESRFKEVSGLAGSEGGLPAAKKILDELFAMFREILNAPDPRSDLQQKNVKMANDQRLLRDMARQFEAERSAFKSVVLAKAITDVENKGKSGAMQPGDVQDNLKTLASLEKTASAAGKIVKPYVSLLETLPHKRLGSDAAPRMDKAQADFDKARNMLVEARRTAERIAGSTTTTNVNITEDLKKVQKNWADQAKQFAAAMRNTTTEINKAVAELEKVVDQEGGVTSGELIALKQNAAKAVELVNGMVTHFRMDAFAGPFSVLTDEGTKNDKSRLKAREDALQTMRQYRTDILKDPLLVKLTNPENPFNQPQMMAASGYLRAALKRVETETLIGI